MTMQRNGRTLSGCGPCGALAAALLLLAAGAAWAQPPATAPTSAPAPAPVPGAPSPGSGGGPPETAPGGEAEPARAPVLGVGDVAPPLSIGAWLTGGPAKTQEPARVMVVEFWATWCVPCRRSVPLLSGLAQRHGEKVQVVGVAGVDAQGETRERVEAFVGKRREQIAYAIAFDDGATTRAAWLGAARIARIPTAFVVAADGRIAWIGDPVASGKAMERAVAELLAGTFDMPGAVAAAKAERARRAAAEEAGLELQGRLREAIGRDDHEGIIAVVDQLLRLDDQRFGRLAALKTSALLEGRQDAKAAQAFAREMLTGRLREDATALDAIAWALVEHAPSRDVALELALRANELAEEEDPRILDTLARIRFDRDEVEEAIRLQRRAVERAGGTGAGGKGLAAKLGENLTRYEAAVRK